MHNKTFLSRITIASLFLAFLVVPLLAEEQEPASLLFGVVETVFPHVAVGGPWTTTLTFVNVGGEDAEFTVRFFRPDGSPWTVTTANGTTASEFSVTADVFSSVDIELPSQGPQIFTGWAEITQPENTTIGGHAIFRDNGGPGRPIPFEAVVPLSTFAEGNTELVEGFFTTLLPFDQTNGFNTCVAFANSSPSFPVTFALILPMPGGSTPLGDDIVLEPLSQTSFCFRDRFAELENQKGVIAIARVEEDLELTVLGFRFDPQGAFTTFFPMAAL